MQSDQIFIDANVILEIILSRPMENAARQLLKIAGPRPCISALTAHLIVHFGLGLTDLQVLRQLLADYEVLALKAVDFEWAFTNARNNDFEDALQLAVAIRNGCQTFVTFDKSLHSAYKTLPNIRLRLLS